MSVLLSGKVYHLVTKKPGKHDKSGISERKEIVLSSKQSDGQNAYERYCAWCERLDLEPAPINVYESVLFRAPVPICK